MPANLNLLPRQPDETLPAVNPEPISAQFAKQIRRIEELEFTIQEIVNWIDLGHPAIARDHALKAIGAPTHAIREL